ncbi:MAG: hypothetical protein K2W78_15170 [Xanthobacteraceae bacterium]|nr:hypothetical protein [Xanthobacteraceae bacterium]
MKDIESRAQTEDVYEVAKRNLEDAMRRRQEILDHKTTLQAGLNELEKRSREVRNKIDDLEKAATEAKKHAPDFLIAQALGQDSQLPEGTKDISKLLEDSEELLDNMRIARARLEEQIRNIDTWAIDGKIENCKAQVVATSPQFRELLDQREKLLYVDAFIDRLCEQFPSVRNVVDESAEVLEGLDNRARESLERFLSGVGLKLQTLN